MKTKGNELYIDKRGNVWFDGEEFEKDCTWWVDEEGLLNFHGRQIDSDKDWDDITDPDELKLIEEGYIETVTPVPVWVWSKFKRILPKPYRRVKAWRIYRFKKRIPQRIRTSNFIIVDLREHYDEFNFKKYTPVKCEKEKSK